MALIISKSDAARRRRVDPSAVSKAVREGGALHAALLGDRIDRSHPAAGKWLGDPIIHDTSVDDLAAAAGITVAEVSALLHGGALQEAAIPVGHVSVSQFARLSGFTIPV